MAKETDKLAEIRVGRLEKLVILVVSSILVGGIGWAWQLGNTQIGKLSDAVIQLSRQQALTNQQLDTLSKQLSDYPHLSQQVAELRVIVDRNSADLYAIKHETNNK